MQQKTFLENVISDADYNYLKNQLKKDKNMIKEFKNYVKESEEKYKNPSVIKRAIFKGCPNCGHTITVCCKDYVDFYSPKKDK